MLGWERWTQSWEWEEAGGRVGPKFPTLGCNGWQLLLAPTCLHGNISHPPLPPPLLPLNNYTQRYTAIIQAKVQMIIWRPSLNLYQSKHTSLNDWYFRFQKETQFNRKQLLMWKHQYLKKGGTRQGLSLDQQHFSDSSPASECSALSAWHDFSTRFWRLIQGVHK